MVKELPCAGHTFPSVLSHVPSSQHGGGRGCGDRGRCASILYDRGFEPIQPGPTPHPEDVPPTRRQHHGDEINGTVEIDENAPNEANFDETMSIAEPQQSIEVTADSDARSALDNGAAEPGDDSTLEQGKAHGSSPASGNITQETPDSSELDLVYGGSLPARLSKRETRRLRRENEGRAVQRMVEEKLKARFLASDILMSALTMPLSSGPDP